MDAASLRLEILGCRACPIWSYYMTVVPPDGNWQAGLMFVGRDPGKEEIKQGKPFVGDSGCKLDALFKSLGISRDKIFITNVVKCRPWRNKAPSMDEVRFCADKFLKREIELVKPKVIVCLGTESAQYILNSSTPISKLRGRPFDIGGIKVIATWHPSFLIRWEKRDPDQYRVYAWQMYNDVKMALENL